MDGDVVVETVGFPEILTELQNIRADLSYYRDISTVLVAIVLAFVASNALIGWLHGR